MYGFNFEKQEQKSKSETLLIRFKEEEKKTKFYSERINKNTTVFCKNKQNIEMYKKLFKK